MKKLLLLIFFTWLIDSQGFSQNLDFEVKIDSVNIGEKMLFNVNVLINSSYQTFSIAIFDKEPWNGGKKIQSADSFTKPNYTILGLSRGRYYLCVKDLAGAGNCKWLIIK